jgi:two-component system response regulator AtoC
MTVETSLPRLSALQSETGFVWGRSPAIQPANQIVVDLAPTEIPFLLIGESGTGKDAYARAIHRHAGAEPGPFRKIACSGLHPQHLQRVLRQSPGFAGDHEKLCTLFFDEIDLLGPECQRLLLAFVAERGEEGITADRHARLISATTCDLEKLVEHGKFRRELFFRINGACLRLPSLRERIEDVPALAEHFLNWHAEELRKKAPKLNHKTMELLMTYPWPGNIRELENVARKIVALGDPALAVSDLRAARISSTGSLTPGNGTPLKVAARAASRQTERELILRALERTKWNRKRAARELQISYKSLLYKLKQIEGPNSNTNEQSGGGK